MMLLKKYGIDAFTFEEIEYTENYNEREQYWIDYYDTTNSNNSKVFQHINRGITHHDSNEEYPLRRIKQYDQPVETMEGQSSSTFNI